MELLKYFLTKSKFLEIILSSTENQCKAAVPLVRIMSPIVRDRDKFNNREQSETNRKDENSMCDYSSEYLRMCFRLDEESSRPYLDILRTLCERSKNADEDK